MHLCHSSVLLPAAALLFAVSAAVAQSKQDVLFQRAVKATKCEQVPNNGRYCTYDFGPALTIGIT